MLDDCVEEVKLMSQECTESARAAIQTRPLAAVAMALAVGLLIGSLSR